MIGRLLNARLLYLLQHYPAVVLLGPRQVGKTTLAWNVSSGMSAIYLDLESDADIAKLSEPELYLYSHDDKLVILDEVQRLPDLFKPLRGIIDKGRRNNKGIGRFLLLGSASIDLLHQTSESLAGRIAFIELSPLNMLEIGLAASDVLWSRGGFPDSFLAVDDALSFRWRSDFIRTYLERDIPQLGPRIPAETLKRFWVMLAHSQAGLLNAASLARGLGVDGKTIAKYLDLLVDLLLVRRLQPWHKNTGKRLVKSPRIYIRDSGITHALLGIADKESLLSHPIVGASWEAFVIENVITSAPEGTLFNFYRTSAGAEIDLILTLPGNKLCAVEIKRSLNPKPTKGFYNACEDLQPDFKFIVYPGEERFLISNDVTVINVYDLAEFIYLEKL
ncbi:Mlr9349 protein [hydrothermal vent metagenome]|uniref:Mlr9349 protein n=1 Tax=hydrothermal vent metagenome TaxID=652676 RepID=A0A3B0X804_9ZZZZ